jgi:hypothetical protein
MRLSIILLLFLIFSHKPTIGQEKTFQVIIIGGGASGIAAGLQSARSGIKTLIIEEYQWLGGMLTAAGVSAFDGNHQIAGGIWSEFRDSLYRHYGGPHEVETGWVSNTLFEPHVGNRIFNNMAAHEKNLTIIYGKTFTSIKRKDNLWYITTSTKGSLELYTCNILIDATETGQVCKYLDISADIGMESYEKTNEFGAGNETNNIIQDLTYVAILKDYGPTADMTIPKPDSYDPVQFRCCCDTSDPSLKAKPNINCAKMMTYGKLPNNKYMINWPNCGNDIYLHTLNDNTNNRNKKLQLAKNHTLKFIYYIQSELGYKNLGLADDEFPTADLLPMIPYHRESRRIKGLSRLQAQHLAFPFDQPQKYYRNGIAVGDYPIDHHHKMNPDAPAIDFINIKIPSYNIPLGSLIPLDIEGLIVAEKSISVSNIVNGTTRLQPVVLGIGQAAGALAVEALKTGDRLRDVSIRKVQQSLLDAGAYILPYIDTKPQDKHFTSIQRIGVTGILKGSGVNYKWANQTWFYPDKYISEFDFLKGLKEVYPILAERRDASGQDLTIGYFYTLMQVIKSDIRLEDIFHLLDQMDVVSKGNDTLLNRLQVAVLLDKILDPFSIPVDHNGVFTHQK